MHGDHSTLMKMQRQLMMYAQRMRQVADMLNYGETQIWKCLKTSYPHVCTGYYSQLVI